jgi:hypothetical protein
MTTNVFEFATRNKLRFTSVRGVLTVEQLWEVPLRSNDLFNLDTIAKTANKALKEVSEESFVEANQTPELERWTATMEVIKHVIAVKLEEEEANRRRAQNKLDREKLLRILAEKQEGRLSELSEKELQKRIAALEE